MQDSHIGSSCKAWFGTKPRYSRDLRVILAIQHYGYGFNKRHTSSAPRSLNTIISAIHHLSFQISSLPIPLVLLPREIRCGKQQADL